MKKFYFLEKNRPGVGSDLKLDYLHRQADNPWLKEQQPKFFGEKWEL